LVICKIIPSSSNGTISHWRSARYPIARYWLSAAAVQRKAIVSGLDLVQKMLTIARLRCSEAEFHEGDAENLPFTEKQFDAVVCNFGFPHFPNPEQAIAHMQCIGNNC
jgi:ubiquinone/menaquinone biosynthesis C-methylase UbiE